MDNNKNNENEVGRDEKENEIDKIIEETQNKNDSDESKSKKGKFVMNVDYDKFEDYYSDEDEAEDDESEEDDEPEQEEYRPKKRKKKNYSVFGGLVLTVFILAVSAVMAITVIVVGRDVLGIGDSKAIISISIPQGATTKEIAQILKDENIIQFTSVFRAVSKLKGADGNMYPGEIELSSNMSYEAIINKLLEVREEEEAVKVTFTEGITLVDAANILEESGVCSADEFIEVFNTKVYGYDFEELVEDSELKFYKMEGYCFPDTYEFYEDESADTVAKRIKARFAEMVNANMLGRMEDMGYTLDELMAFASIVQKEAGDPAEMKKVASVFTNRLRNSDEFPKLQSDTTDNYVEQVIKPNDDGDNQEMYDAYDTYVGIGLPPGAVCNPGIDAINAVLYPAETDYFYFCSNLETKEFFYAKTLAEHEENLKLAGLAD